MEFKGTKGKWTPSKQRGKKGHCILAQVFCEEESLLILNPKDNEEESSYNSLLISKAPEMLEILKTIVDDFDFVNEGKYHNFNIEQARKIIKEATEL